MKEYINKTTGEYRKTSEVASGERWVEIPSDAEYLTKSIWIDELYLIWWKDGFKKCIGSDNDWVKVKHSALEYLEDVPSSVLWQRPTQPESLPFANDEPSLKDQYLEQAKKINDACASVFKKQDDLLTTMLNHSSVSINNQYAEIEKVRQAIKVKSGSNSDHIVDAMSYGFIGLVKERENNHYFKDVSDIDTIDVYEVLKRFNVTDPCLQHLIKKALCVGNRGHKDLETDLRDILKTAKRALEINGFSL